MYALHNLSPDGSLVRLHLEDLEPGTRLVDLLDPVDRDTETPVPESRIVELDVDGYGYRWLLPLAPGVEPPV